MRMFGTIYFYHPHKAFGFISNQTGSEYFFHVTAMKPGSARPEVGRSVSFMAAQTRKGPVALDIEIVPDVVLAAGQQRLAGGGQ